MQHAGGMRLTSGHAWLAHDEGGGMPESMADCAPRLYALLAHALHILAELGDARDIVHSELVALWLVAAV